MNEKVVHFSITTYTGGHCGYSTYANSLHYQSFSPNKEIYRAELRTIVIFVAKQIIWKEEQKKLLPAFLESQPEPAEVVAEPVMDGILLFSERDVPHYEVAGFKSLELLRQPWCPEKGLARNEYSGIFQNTVTLADLMK